MMRSATSLRARAYFVFLLEITAVYQSGVRTLGCYTVFVCVRMCACLISLQLAEWPVAA